ncbi:MAG: pyruvate dehydrogenase complex dihydrolipoamide acetyltransferase [bacterium]|nr:pyruvate dehydrogenase complex dihydrolipoamide acetyltransferase [bacterium]
MPTIIEMPKMSDTMDTGTLVAWHKNEGDAIESGEVIAEVETDKATMELEAYESGVLLKILAREGEAVPVGDPLAIVGENADEDIGAMLKTAESKKGAAPAKAVKPAGKAVPAPPADRAAARIEEASAEPAVARSEALARPPAEARPATDRELPAPATGVGPRPTVEAPRDSHRVVASPLAARLAQEEGLNLALIKGSGPGGRIIKRDIERARSEGLAATAPVGLIPAARYEPRAGAEAEAEYEDVPNSPMRKTIAARLADSKSHIPHYYVTVEIDMTQALALRRQLNALEEIKISINDFALKAAALALEKHPLMNASFQGTYIRVYHRIDIGVAVAMEDGLITPVIRNINRKGLRAISEEARELAERARRKRLRPEEFTGGTFTVSNLGMLGVKHFTAVINPPEAGILAIGAVREVPVVEGGEVRVGQRMDATLSSDHRVVDGAQSARFLQDFRFYMENPMTFAL